MNVASRAIADYIIGMAFIERWFRHIFRCFLVDIITAKGKRRNGIFGRLYSTK